MTSAERAARLLNALAECKGPSWRSAAALLVVDAIDAAVAEALAEIDATRAALATDTANANAYAHERDEALDMLRGTVRTLTTTRSLLGADASETVIEAAQRIAEALPRWVPVGERLPEARVPVLVSLDDRPFPEIDYLRLGGYWFNRNHVVAWQPLPAPWVAP